MWLNFQEEFSSTFNEGEKCVCMNEYTTPLRMLVRRSIYSTLEIELNWIGKKIEVREYAGFAVLQL